MSIAKKIRELREQKGMSQAALGEAAGLTMTYINLVENEKKSPTLKSLEKISRALEIPFPVLAFLALDPEKDMSPHKRKIYKEIGTDILEVIEEVFLR